MKRIKEEYGWELREADILVAQYNLSLLYGRLT